MFKVANLSVYSESESIVTQLSLTLEKKRPVTILGETGSGKSLLAQAIMGALPENLNCSGEIKLFGRDDYTKEELEQLWGRKIAMLPQEPWLSLDPIMAGRKQVALVESLVNGKSSTVANEQVDTRMAEFGLCGDGDKVPAHLSGGMAQRLAYLCSTAAGAEVLIADEPTKGLDASRKGQVITLLQKQSHAGGLLTITHDIDVAEALGGDLIVMRQGQIVEQGACAQVLNNPRSDYARELIAAHRPDYKAHQPVRSGNTLIKAHQLAKYRGGKQLFTNLDLGIDEGEIIGLVGDSGTGKSTLADMLLGLVPVENGVVERSSQLSKGKALKLYQDPPAAFPQTVTLGQNIKDLCILHKLDQSQIPAWMKKLRLDMKLLERLPGKVSGGELQRFAIMRALMMSPKLLVADEPTSRLDPIIAAETLSLLIEHTREMGCALLLISHDSHAVNQVCDRVMDLSDYQGSLKAKRTLTPLLPD
ncbi:hypothetical protein ACH42_02520 [Endozoicomonas sp. (ex Bugula neritina AB1)]|nr:hypothetical protein ACH42_02520 [Endozoicomonas sp. (ex Bugula neritina AB1)]